MTFGDLFLNCVIQQVNWTVGHSLRLSQKALILITSYSETISFTEILLQSEAAMNFSFVDAAIMRSP